MEKNKINKICAVSQIRCMVKINYLVVTNFKWIICLLRLFVLFCLTYIGLLEITTQHLDHYFFENFLDSIIKNFSSHCEGENDNNNYESKKNSEEYTK
jgi:hypothetical protein